MCRPSEYVRVGDHALTKPEPIDIFMSAGQINVGDVRLTRSLISEEIITLQKATSRMVADVLVSYKLLKMKDCFCSSAIEKTFWVPQRIFQ